jgi:hypothetical protein
MKYLLLGSIALASFLYLDYRYERELIRVYEFNRFVLQTYCHPNSVKP